MLDATGVPLVPGVRPATLTVELVRGLMQAAQSGRSADVAALGSSWISGEPTPDDTERFILLSVLYICAQTDRSDLDEDDIVEEMIGAAERCGSRSAQATAFASRALTAATRGQSALASPDLCRATTLLEESGPEPAVDFPAFHLRRQACNTLALALTRQGIHDHAVHWLDEFRRTSPPMASSSVDRFLATFNEAWIHLTSAIDLDLDPTASADDAAARYRAAATTFQRAAVERNDEPGKMVASAEHLASAAAILGGDLRSAARLRAVTETLRPDHRAICQLALARADAAVADIAVSLDRLDAALADLPADHSFRSIAVRLMTERVAILFDRGAAESDSTPYRPLVDILLQHRLDERRTYRVAYESGLDRERQRLALIAEHALAQIDQLTGLATRPVLSAALDRALAAVGDRGCRAVVLFVDLDGLKGVNDSRSHLAGDLVLQLFGRQVRHLLHNDDTAVRYGGDEFVLILMDRSVAEARTELLGLRTQLGSITAARAEIGAAVTFSAGVVEVTPDATPGELLRSADLAMFTGKRSGGDAIAVGPVLREPA